MIKKETFTKDNIDRIVAKYKVDYELAARAVFALGLVEALCKVGTKFIFKGGSSLMLLFDTPKRLSTDVDILVSPEYDIESYLFKASSIFPFKGIEESVRKTNKKISKKHYRITYSSTNSNKEFAVLVDVLFADNNYKELVHLPIHNDLLLCDAEDYYVDMPSAESLLGDKLTAFAPHTIGINFFNDNYSNDKRLEIIKQFYDVSCLFDASKNFNNVIETYKKVAMDEIGYRELDKSIEDCLYDSFIAALSILSLGKFGGDDYQNYISGFKKIIGHIFGKRLNPNNASVDAAKIMFLSACLIKNINPFEYQVVKQELIIDKPYNQINFVRKIDMVAYNYAATAIKLINS